MSFLEKTLLPTEAKEELNNLGEDQLIGQMRRQLGQALAANRLVFSRFKRWKYLANKEAFKAVEHV